MSPVADRLRIIRREDTMGKARWLVASIALGLVMRPAAHAQPSAERNVEVGGGVGSVLSWFTSPLLGGDVRVTVPMAARGDVEFLAAAGQTPEISTDLVGFYGGQFRLRFREQPASALQPFMTIGAIGLVVHSHYGTDVSPPLLALVGGGMEKRVRQRLIVRGEAQSIMLVVIPVGVRVAAGVSIPIGSTR